MNRDETIKVLLILGACLLGLGSSGIALSAKADRDLQADIEAGNWVDDPQKGYQIFSQGVVLVQGSLHVEADKATVYRDDDGGTFSRIILEGRPARWSEILDDGSKMNAQAHRIDYNLDDDTVVLRQGVVVNKGSDRISGELIRYNIKTQLLRAGAEKPGTDRIKMTVSPKKDPDS